LQEISCGHTEKDLNYNRARTPFERLVKAVVGIETYRIVLWIKAIIRSLRVGHPVRLACAYVHAYTYIYDINLPKEDGLRGVEKGLGD
jgi:hypothetical protein